MKKRRKKIIILILFSFVFFYKLEKTIQLEKENKEKIESYFETDLTTNDKFFLKNKTTNSYLGILEIPKINLKRGFYPYENPQNTVEKNIEIINKNCLPYESCPFILASHSGTSNIAFFKNLNKLKEKDKAILYYQNHKKEYILKEILHQSKNGFITLEQKRKEQLILTTCNKENDNLQDIYIFET